MNSQIILCKNIRLDRNYVNVLNYTEQQMLTLCNSNNHKITSLNNCSFIRSNNSIQVEISYSQCLQANYIAFQNPDYSNKWFFAWIDDIIYKGNDNTEILYTIDAWSTWFDKWTTNNCYVLREHVNDDTIGKHTIEENLNTGVIISDFEDTLEELGAESYFWIVIACNYDPNNDTRYAGLGMYNGYPQGTMWFAWSVNRYNYASSINEINEWLKKITQKNQQQNISSIFTLPFQALKISDVDENHLVKVGDGGEPLNTRKSYTKEALRLNYNYVPKNNKCYVYPYSFVRITNNSGAINDYHIEDFESDSINFDILGVGCEGFSGKIRPVNYKGIENNEDESIPLGKYPTLSWSSDSFTSWLTSQAVNMGITIASSIGNLKSSYTDYNTKIENGKDAKLNTSGISQMLGLLEQTYNASFLPNTPQGNINSGDINFALNITRFKVMHMRPKDEFLEIIDNFFTRYGYAINNIKVPNITGRQYFNYVQIGSDECIGFGSVPTKFMEIINNACRRGTTVWHNHNNIGNYNLNNSIIN